MIGKKKEERKKKTHIHFAFSNMALVHGLSLNVRKLKQKIEHYDAGTINREKQYKLVKISKSKDNSKLINE